MHLIQTKTHVEAVPGHNHYWELWLNAEGRIIYLSPSWHVLPDLNIDDFIKNPKSISRFVYPDDLPLFEKHWVDSVEKKVHGEMDFRVVMPDGSIRWIRHSCSPFFDEQGRYTGTRGTNYDITERKYIEHIIKAQRDLGLALDQSSSLADSLELCLEAAMNVSHVDVGGIFMLDETTGHLNLVASRGANELLMNGSREFRAYSPVARIVRAGKPYYLDRENILNLLKNKYIDEKMHSIAMIPFFDKGKVIGSLHVTSHVFDEMPLYSRNALEAVAGQIGGAIGRAQAEQNLRVSEKIYRTIFENTGASMVILDDDTTILLANAEFEKISGYTKQELEGKRSWTDFVVEEDLERMLANHRRRKVDPQSVPGSYEFGFRDRKNNIRYAFLTVDLISGTQKAVASLVDITQRKQYENEIREREERFRTIVETSNAGIIRMTQEGEILFANQRMALMFGYTHDEFLSGNYYDYVDPAQKTDVTVNILKLKSGTVKRLSVEHLFVRKDGSPLWGYVNGGRLDTGGGSFHVVLFITDTTHVREIENEKKRLEDHLRQSQKMEAIGTLAGGIAHDFNNILASMMGFTEIAIQEERPEVRTKYLGQVMKSCERAKGLVDRILTFSRPRDQERKPVDVRLILNEAVSLLRASLPTTIEIVQDITTEETTVLADPTQIHQIVMNLCTNAAHAMRGTNGVLAVTLDTIDILPPVSIPHPDLSAGSYVRLSVSDTGCGMDAAVKDRIFEPFFTTKPSGEGTGLGLSVVYNIVKNAGGAITVASEAGRGAVFNVYLPRITAQTIQSADKWKYIDLRGRESILFVDDEEPLVDVAKDYFESFGYRVTGTSSSIEAMRLFEENPDAFDVVITDMTMPRLTGADLSRQMLEIRPDLPIIMCTGYSDAMNTTIAEQMRIREFVMKPVLLHELAYLVRRVLLSRS